ncbi:hypothetical protein FRACYDRAFT_235501 [Fragilariopsis cylindrus CCMP1102]|uniref:Uncharacterized protein n=1 Tax=Fragilariopsis cylindrus CCMP1102 TaxID=635003 RepID=A0A1E7FMT4_9STRA|nr:hypothetical protein FRACYDRAFT_235501 [Fragilariopsis cylindrus CCMP1102]|eukprot:OEU19447.1 hypothetical protein FRACYDRAFT_235501 [Fragilariopsis cylindrus CCMP1102]
MKPPSINNNEDISPDKISTTKIQAIHNFSSPFPDKIPMSSSNQQSMENKHPELKTIYGATNDVGVLKNVDQSRSAHFVLHSQRFRICCDVRHLALGIKRSDEDKNGNSKTGIFTSNAPVITSALSDFSALKMPLFDSTV